MQVVKQILVLSNGSTVFISSLAANNISLATFLEKDYTNSLYNLKGNDFNSKVEHSLFNYKNKYLSNSK
jgi:hypothetical protein